MITGILVCVVVAIIAIFGCTGSPMKAKDNEVNDIGVGEAHNMVLKHLESRKLPLFNDEGLVPYANLDTCLVPSVMLW